LLGVGAVSVSVTVQDVVPPYRIGLGLQMTVMETASFVAALLDGTTNVTNSRATSTEKISQQCVPLFRLLGENSG